MSKYNKERLMEVMGRLDKTFKPQLNEDFGGNTDDPTKEEMFGYLMQRFAGSDLEIENMDFDIAAAIYWFANDYHGGQNSNLYSALSTSEYKPGPMHKSIEDDESETATMMYQDLVNKYGGGLQEKDDKWIQKAVDPEHKGYCTPMTKDTCTPRRKALAKRFKAGIEDESIMEAFVGDDPEEYRIMVEKLKASMDNLFAEEHFDVIDTLYRLIVERKKPLAPQVNED